MSGLRMRLTEVDERLLQKLVLRRRPAADVTMRIVTRLGDPLVVTSLTLALALGAVPHLQEAGELAMWCLIASHVLVQLIKRRVCRPRPRLPVGLGFLIEPEDRFSFPSGHAAGALSVALPMAVALDGVLGPLVLAVGLLVGVSRCYLGVHYPGDVVVGWCLASVAFLAAPMGGGVAF